MTENTIPQSSTSPFSAAVSRLRPLVLDRLSALRDAHTPPLPEAIDAERKTMHTRSGATLSYYVDKCVHGRPVVLLHSINACASAYEMKPLFERFRSIRPTYAPDLPGFGFSDRGATTYTPALYVEELTEFLTRVKDKGDAPDVVALSLSCEFAALVAASRKDLVHTLTLISPTGLEKDDDGHKKAPLARSGQATKSPGQAPWWSSYAFGALASHPSIRYFLKKSFVGSVDDGLLEYAYATSHQKGAERAPFAFLKGQLFTPGIYETYAKLDRPALVLYDRDGFVTFDRLSSVVGSSPMLASKRVAPSRGMPQFELPNQTVEALEEFWRAHERSHHAHA